MKPAHGGKAAQAHNDDFLKPAANAHAEHSPLRHQAGKDWRKTGTPFFGADTIATQPLGVIGPDAALSQRITAARRPMRAFPPPTSRAPRRAVDLH